MPRSRLQSCHSSRRHSGGRHSDRANSAPRLFEFFSDRYETRATALTTNLQARRAGSPDLKQTYAESINPIIAMASVHQILAHEPDAFVNLKKAITQLAETIAQTMANPRQFISIEVSGEELYLDCDVANTVCLVINQLVQNSFKLAFVHATGGRIAIKLNRKRDRVYIDVWDNGSGANVATENGGTGLGLRLAETLLE